MALAVLLPWNNTAPQTKSAQQSFPISGNMYTELFWNVWYLTIKLKMGLLSAIFVFAHFKPNSFIISLTFCCTSEASAFHHHYHDHNYHSHHHNSKDIKQAAANFSWQSWCALIQHTLCCFKLLFNLQHFTEVPNEAGTGNWQALHSAE